jgi:hypothetical protein
VFKKSALIPGPGKTAFDTFGIAGNVMDALQF